MFLHLHQVLLTGKSGQMSKEDQKQRPAPVVVPACDAVAGQEDLEVGGRTAGAGRHAIASVFSEV